MTILFTYPTLFNPIVGGVERVTDLLAKSFISLGYGVLYLVNKQEDALMDYHYPATVYFFPEEDPYAAKNIEFYHQFLKEHHVDVVINQAGILSEVQCYLNVGNTDTKTITVLHSSPLAHYKHLANEIFSLRNDSFMEKLKWIARLVLFPKIKKNTFTSQKNHLNSIKENTNKIVILSKKFRDELKLLGVQDNIVAIPNPNTFQAVEFPIKKKKQLLFVGRLDRRQKRPDRILKIWKNLFLKFPDWELILLGEGKEWQNLEYLIRTMKLERVILKGAVSNPEEYYKEASILCMTSNAEGWGMVLTEAMQFGTIPIAYDSFASVTDIIIPGETGELVKPFNQKEYICKLMLLMSDENKRQEMSRNAYEQVKQFDIDTVSQQWVQLFSQLNSEK
jgi:glycosyltransferase involved in cell wall biosynthesis